MHKILASVKIKFYWNKKYIILTIYPNGLDLDIFFSCNYVIAILSVFFFISY